MKYLLIMTSSENVINFRSTIIKFLKNKGHKVVVVAHDNERQKEIEDLGTVFYYISQNNRGLNPFAILKYFINLFRIIKKEVPDCILTYQLKPNLFGVMSGSLAGIKKIYATVEGLGDVYINSGLKWGIIKKIVNFLYRLSFKKVSGVFFLNEEDKNEFASKKLVLENKCKVIHGIGVDLKKFRFTPLKNEKNFIMVARMMKTKGIFRYCECARIVKKKYPDAVFGLLGREVSTHLTDIKEYIEDKSIEYYGTTKDVRPYLEEASVFLLPSYREGCPVSIMEAEAMGRAIITSNAVGCKDTVLDEYNGFIVEDGDPEKMAEKLIWLIENPEEMKKMGINAEKFAKENFDAEKVNNEVYEFISGEIQPEMAYSKNA